MCPENLNELNDLIDILIKKYGIDRFPEFQKLIVSTCINNVFLPNTQKTYLEIETELSSQNYIWTENIHFIEALNNSKSNNVSVIRNLATNYYKSVVYIIQDAIRKR